MNRRILFIGGNFSPELIGIGKYNGEMIDFLAKHGYDCTVLTSYPYYPQWAVQQPYLKNKFWYKKEIMQPQADNALPATIYRCPQYVPKRPTGIRRILLDMSFFLSAGFKVIQLLAHKKYDVVITVAPCFQIGLLGMFYKKIRGGKFLYHIQDLQIDAARDLGMIKSRRVIKYLLSIEKRILRNADTVSSISVAMMNKIKQKYNRDVVFFPNWVNTSLFYPVHEKKRLKEEFNFSAVDTIVLYSGAIGEKQSLENILFAAKQLKHINTLKFVICGTGPYKEKLVQLKDEWGLGNVFFFPLQPSEKLNHFLNMADIHLVLQKAMVGDLVMPSKLTTILSVGGLAIITAIEESNLYQLIAKHEMGVLVEPENSMALIAAIEEILDSNKKKINQNARRYAEDYLSIDNIFASYALNM
jgi:colanic acid biosynthesis glycosyl transferase WcaI